MTGAGIATDLAGAMIVFAVGGLVYSTFEHLATVEEDARCPHCGGPLTIWDEPDLVDASLLMVSHCRACGGEPRYHFWVNRL